MSKKDIHPKENNIKIICSTCNTVFETVSTLDKDFNVDTCSSCHPFYSGKQKFSSKGRVEKFNSKLAKKDLFNSAKKVEVKNESNESNK